MGSRRVYFFVPESKLDMNFGAAIETLERAAGVRFEKSFFLNEFDSDGSPMPIFEETSIESLPQLVAITVNDRRSLEIECANVELGMVCSFGSPHKTQLMSVAISRKMLSRLPLSRLQHYEEAIARAASDAGAAFLVIVDDPPDDFYGRLVAVDDSWIIDFDTTNYQVDPSRVLALRKSCKLPEMRNLQASGLEIAGFHEFRETL